MLLSVVSFPKLPTFLIFDTHKNGTCKHYTQIALNCTFHALFKIFPYWIHYEICQKSLFHCPTQPGWAFIIFPTLKSSTKVLKQATDSVLGIIQWFQNSAMSQYYSLHDPPWNTDMPFQLIKKEKEVQKSPIPLSHGCQILEIAYQH